MVTLGSIDRSRAAYYFGITGDEGVRNKKVLDLVCDAVSCDVSEEQIEELRPLLNERGFEYIANLIRAYQSGDVFTIFTATQGK